jgi:predicted translation initiation factor SUI1
MTKLTGGPGWALVPDNEAQPPGTGHPGSPKPKIRLEKRAGKQVTVITGLHTYGTERLEAIARELKTRCGAGGTVKNGTIEIQGDKIAGVQAWFKTHAGDKS